MVSSVDLLGRCANSRRSMVTGREDVMKVLMNKGYGLIVIKADELVFLWNMDYDCLIEAYGNNALRIQKHLCRI